MRRRQKEGREKLLMTAEVREGRGACGERLRRIRVLATLITT